MIIARHAELSLDGRYRYRLTRLLDSGDSCALWIGVNPSTADAEVDDASIRKLYGFGQGLGIGKWMVGNLFAYRATNPKVLATVRDPIGPDCDFELKAMIADADVVIAGWGRIDKVPLRLRYRVGEIQAMAEERGKPLMCWGTCQDGSPAHPLMLPYTRQLREWKP